ncbi:MAG: ferritin-like domain-containing protein [Solirubrobacteraceae bacterium]
MSTQFDLEKLDADGDMREAAEDAGHDRSTFLRNGAFAGAGLVAGSTIFGLPALAQAKISRRPSAKNDIRILNYALTLEYLEAGFYRAAVDADDFATPQLKQFAQVVAKHEQSHVDFLRKGLGRRAIKKPKFNADTVATLISREKFAGSAELLEDTGVAAYAGQGPNLKTRAFVKAALGIHSVEARHAAWIRVLNGGGEVGAPVRSYPAPRTFDSPKSEATVLRAVKGLDVLA